MTENQVCDKSQIIPFLISISMSNGSQISNQVEACDLEEYTPVIDGWLFYLHTGMIFIIVWASFKIQRALIRTFKKLGSRHINSIVVPTIVSFEQNNRSEKFRTKLLCFQSFWIFASEFFPLLSITVVENIGK